jgi:hypothetical protein
MGRTRVRAVVAGAAAAALLLSSCSDDGPDYEAAPAPQVDLAVELPANLTIGLVRSTDATQDLTGMATGARVAEYRLEGLTAKGNSISLHVVNDHGTPEGAVEAVEELARGKVAGIVYAAAGPQLAAGFAKASDLGIPVLAPFEVDDSAASGHDHVWLTGPASRAELEAIRTVNTQRNLELKVIQAAPGYAEDALASFVQDRLAIDGSADPTSIDNALTEVLDPSAPPGAFLVWGPPIQTANVVAALQRFPYPVVPIYTSSDTTGPSFAAALESLQAVDQAVTDGPLLSVAASTDLDPSAANRAFLSALHLVAADAEVRSIDGLSQLGAQARDADARAHDAVLLLANAARRARSAAPSAVAKALVKLRAADVPGLVGPMPSFRRSSALTAEQLVIVQVDPLGSDARTDLPEVEVAGDAAPGPRFGWVPVDTEES